MNRRFVYKGPDDIWAWSSDCGREWSFGSEENIGQRKCSISVSSSAPTPESIAAKHWQVVDEDGEWQLANLTATASATNPLISSKALAHIGRNAVSGDDAVKAAMLCIVLKLAREHTYSRHVTMKYARTRLHWNEE